METAGLVSAVERFAGLVGGLSDAELETPWQWGDYDEGVRFAFFRFYEDLRTLAARLAAGRSKPATLGQSILAQYLAAYRDLQAVVSGVSDEDGTLIPAEGEWKLRQVIAHLVKAERTFYAINLYTLRRERSMEKLPDELPDEEWEAMWAGDPFPRLAEDGLLSELMAYYAGLHEKVLEAFTDVSNAELEATAVFWESTPMPVEFRLHRFDAHLRQHTIQAEKTLIMLGKTQNEAKRLLRLIYNALAEVEGALLGVEADGQSACAALAGSFNARTEEIAAALAAAEGG